MNPHNSQCPSGTGTSTAAQVRGQLESVILTLRKLLENALRLENEMLESMAGLYECVRPVPQGVEDYGLEKPPEDNDRAGRRGEEHRSVHHVPGTDREVEERRAAACRARHAVRKAQKKARRKGRRRRTRRSYRRRR